MKVNQNLNGCILFMLILKSCSMIMAYQNEKDGDNTFRIIIVSPVDLGSAVAQW